jgi:DNA-binding LytR/AlgR family response regulator
MISCYIIDDEFHAIEILSDLIALTPGLELAGHQTSPLMALEDLQSSRPPDITFIDIHMPELSGMAFAAHVQQLTTVIFTTAYAKFAVEAFERDAFDYLLKPISQERFLTCITKYKKKLGGPAARPKEDFFYVKSDVKGKMVRINTPDITYIEGALNYVIIHLLSDTKQITYLTMSEIEQYLPENDFLRIHKSFIVNTQKIRFITGEEISLVDKSILSIGSAYKAQFLERLNPAVLISKRKP